MEVLHPKGKLLQSSRGYQPYPKQRDHMEALGIRSRHSEAAFRHFVHIQGLPESFDLPAFSSLGKCKAVCNGVPLAMGRAIAAAVIAATATSPRQNETEAA